jgi:hypothetical protein
MRPAARHGARPTLRLRKAGSNPEGDGRDRRPGREGRGWPCPHPGSQARRVLHPRQARRRRLPCARPGIHERHCHLRARRDVRALGAAEGIRRGADHVRQLTVLGDGAAWIWNIVTGKFPGATRIVDLYHAREHLHAFRSLEFMLLDRKDEWLAARLEDLDYGDIDGIEAVVREYSLAGVEKDEIEKELGYFPNNAPACATTGSAPAACS